MSAPDPIAQAAGWQTPPQTTLQGGDEDVEREAGPERLRASVRVEEPRWEPEDGVALADRVLCAVAASAHAPAGPATLDVVFSDDRTLGRLNGRFRGKDAPTNVLSFPSGDVADEGEAFFLGGIALAYETCAAEARERGIKFQQHATHLLLHGVLHLLGFDHQDDGEAREMECLEVEILATLGVADPYEGK